MRSLLLVLIVLAACGGRARDADAAGATTAVAPAHDLARGQADAQPVDRPITRAEGSARRRPRHHPHHARSETSPASVEMEHVATADLFKQANEAAKVGRDRAGDLALPPHRHRVSRVPVRPGLRCSTSPPSTTARAISPQTIATLRELVKAYPNARESIDGHLYIAALQADHEQFAEANATLDEVLARDEPDVRRPGRGVRAQGLRPARAQAATTTPTPRSTPRSPSGGRRHHIDDPYYIAMATLLPRRARAPEVPRRAGPAAR